MCITYHTKDLTTIDQGLIVHGCNAQGVMGAGVAYALSKKWPRILEGYQDLCKSYTPDQLLGCAHFVTVENGRVMIGNLITQKTFGSKPRKYADVHAIEQGLKYAAQIARALNHTLYMPKIGCLRGGLDWDQDVEPIVKNLDMLYNSKLDIRVCDL